MDGVDKLSVIVCAAGPAADTETMARLAVDATWDTQLIATPPALAFFDTHAIRQITGKPVLSEYRKPGSPRSPIPDGIIVAPATYNTICKWALGVSDTYALGVLAEMTGMGVPIVVMPFVNSALASRIPYRRSVESLTAEGVQFLHEKSGAHPPRGGAELARSFPWHQALDEVNRIVHK